MHVMISDTVQSEKSQLTPLQQAFALQNINSASPELGPRGSRLDKSSILQKSEDQSSDLASQFDAYTMKLSHAFKKSNRVSVKSKNISLPKKDPQKLVNKLNNAV